MGLVVKVSQRLYRTKAIPPHKIKTTLCPRHPESNRIFAPNNGKGGIPEREKISIPVLILKLNRKNTTAL